MADHTSGSGGASPKRPSGSSSAPGLGEWRSRATVRRRRCRPSEETQSPERLMPHEVKVLARAEADLDDIATWLAARSPKGVLRWLEAFEQVKGQLAEPPLAYPRA